MRRVPGPHLSLKGEVASAAAGEGLFDHRGRSAVCGLRSAARKDDPPHARNELLFLPRTPDRGPTSSPSPTDTTAPPTSASVSERW
jgi:hypothetical protein